MFRFDILAISKGGRKMSFLQPYLAAAVLPLGFEIGLAVWKKHRGVPVSVWRAVGLFVCGLYVTEVLLLTGIPVLQDFLLGYTVPIAVNLQTADYNIWLFHAFSMNRVDLWLNVFLFVPLGMFVPALWKRGARKRTMLCSSVLAGALLSASIEWMQLWNTRFSDINDLFCNTLGAFCGGLLWLLFTCRRKSALPQVPVPRFLKAEAPLYFFLLYAGFFLLCMPYGI